MGVEDLITATYHPQTNGQVKHLYKTIRTGIRHPVQPHTKHWDLFKDRLTCAWDTKVHLITGHTRFALVLSWPLLPLPLAKDSVHYPKQAPKKYFRRRKKWLLHLNKNARKGMTEGEARYK